VGTAGTWEQVGPMWISGVVANRSVWSVSEFSRREAGPRGQRCDNSRYFDLVGVIAGLLFRSIGRIGHRCANRQSLFIPAQSLSLVHTVGGDRRARRSVGRWNQRAEWAVGPSFESPISVS